MTSHSATDSAVGYYYQCMYALLVMLDSGDGASISVETADDLETYDSGVRSLRQLKHSLGSPRALTLGSSGLWKTLRNWSLYANENDVRFILVTCATVAKGPLRALVDDGETAPVVDALVGEATRVQATREARRAAGDDPGFVDRWPGCAAFLALTSGARESLVGRMRIMDGAPSAHTIEEEIVRRIAPTTLPQHRAIIAERLVSWWDRECVLSLTGQRDRRLDKSEVQRQLYALIVELGEEDLPNLFGTARPDEGADTDCVVAERQIAIVEGGAARISRARLARWRAVAQRQWWLSREISTRSELGEFDDRLVEEWAGRHGPLRDDCVNGSRDPVSGGRSLLDWTHEQAPREVEPIRARWTPPFLVRGTYQQLAQDMRVGWHPDFRSILTSGLPRPKGEADAGD